MNMYTSVEVWVISHPKHLGRDTVTVALLTAAAERWIVTGECEVWKEDKLPQEVSTIRVIHMTASAGESNSENGQLYEYIYIAEFFKFEFITRSPLENVQTPASNFEPT